MTKTKAASGTCLCGAVKIAARNMSTEAGACHCTTCRKWGGGPFMALDCGSDVTFTGEKYIASFASSQWAERGFCKQCGTHLFYKMTESKQYFMPVGLFDEEATLVFDHQVFIDEKPAYYSFSNKTSDLTGPELFAKFSPQE